MAGVQDNPRTILSDKQIYKACKNEQEEPIVHFFEY